MATSMEDRTTTHLIARQAYSVLRGSPKKFNEDGMEIQFHISGSLVSTRQSSMIPQIGSVVVFRMDAYEKGMFPGTILRFTVSEDNPPVFDYNSDVVIIDVNGWNVEREGPEPKDD
jgi:hypothetical protein